MKKSLIFYIGISLIVGFLIGGIYYDQGRSLQPLSGASDPNVIDAPTNTAVSVKSSTSTTVLPLDTGRRYAVIVNDSANTIWLKLGSAATANSGIRLNANGGAYEINEMNLYKGIITAIASSSTSTLTVTYK